MNRYSVATYTDGPATRWNVIDHRTQEWVRRFASETEAKEYAAKLEARPLEETTLARRARERREREQAYSKTPEGIAESEAATKPREARALEIENEIDEPETDEDDQDDNNEEG